ncbi:MAG: alpha-hydroxy-acid oxidizing enzyme [Flavobacteriaceae bacterium]|nr:alpha-hydroxy-acid oxidizing enzyme [Flavobacteriaceae bacterium]|tara:strand:+ start:1371 stop:2513 length:1143 start_codon:yes stop_codon:yes gene_type:complete
MEKFNRKYPSVTYLREKAKKRIPKFAFEYLDGGCNNEESLFKNTNDIRNIEIKPKYITEKKEVSIKTKLFGVEYDAPFGISPIGLQGLIWPKSPEILAKAAFDNNIPFILSTVSTSNIEKISEITEGKAWFQLYHPAEDSITKNILKRAEDSGIKNLVILADVPTFGYRNREIINGLSLPPKLSFSNFKSMLSRPIWLINTLLKGKPSFETLKPYMSRNLSLKQLGKFMDATFSGALNKEKISRLRELWKGNIIIKGLESLEDIEISEKLGLDGVIISNHGGRQIDIGESTINSLKRIKHNYNGKMKIMMDSGIRDGADIARVLACGAEFTFLGRTFMYSVSALGKRGGDHCVLMLKKQLNQIMEQLSCEKVFDLKNHLI